ncbi:hypothetical protein BGW38_009692, partial [Lunasporangiospora selenospora]
GGGLTDQTGGGHELEPMFNEGGGGGGEYYDPHQPMDGSGGGYGDQHFNAHQGHDQGFHGQDQIGSGGGMTGQSDPTMLQGTSGHTGFGGGGDQGFGHHDGFGGGGDQGFHDPSMQGPLGTETGPVGSVPGQVQNPYLPQPGQYYYPTAGPGPSGVSIGAGGGYHLPGIPPPLLPGLVKKSPKLNSQRESQYSIHPISSPTLSSPSDHGLLDETGVPAVGNMTVIHHPPGSMSPGGLSPFGVMVSGPPSVASTSARTSMISNAPVVTTGYPQPPLKTIGKDPEAFGYASQSIPLMHHYQQQQQFQQEPSRNNSTGSNSLSSGSTVSSSGLQRDPSNSSSSSSTYVRPPSTIVATTAPKSPRVLTSPKIVTIPVSSQGPPEVRSPQDRYSGIPV